MMRFMRPTPSPLPDWLTSFRQKPYTNIYEICPSETFVFGTESLYGDWDAELLILAQDPGPAGEFEDLRDSGHSRPFAHREFRPGFPRYDPATGTGGAGTNKTIHRLAEHVDCPKLYGSALVGMCRPGTRYHGKLTNLRMVRPHCVRVLRWVIDPAQMRNLRAIICVGKIASNFARRAVRDGSPIARQPKIFDTSHPAAYAQAGNYANVLPIWENMAQQMGWQFAT